MRGSCTVRRGVAGGSSESDSSVGIGFGIFCFDMFRSI